MEISVDLDSEIQKHLGGLEKIPGYFGGYQRLLDSDLLCGQKQWVRILREVVDVNKDFNNLRTYIAPVFSFIGVFHYLMYPADGALADQPLCGRIIIPKQYPLVPPVVHLLSKTNRYNVDVYHRYSYPEYLHEMHSSMCFDILRSTSEGGIWKPEYTLSALIASLIQSIVCIKVPQESGEEKEEYVTMESLTEVHQNVRWTYNSYKDSLPKQQVIKKIEAAPVKTRHFDFGEYLTSRKDNGNQIITSEQPVLLQVGEIRKDSCVFSIGFDLSGLKVNPYTVFSVVLSNNPDDPLGQFSETVLVRNGITATAAKKKRNQKTQWFYHGIPLNQENLKIIITVGYDQLCMSYLDKEGKVVVHGDCPVSFLTEAEIGRVRHENFYLSVVMRNKGGRQITVRTFKPEVGYLHPIFAAASSPMKSMIQVNQDQMDEEMGATTNTTNTTKITNTITTNSTVVSKKDLRMMEEEDEDY